MLRKDLLMDRRPPAERPLFRLAAHSGVAALLLCAGQAAAATPPVATMADLFFSPTRQCLAADGNLWISDASGGRIEERTPTGMLDSTFVPSQSEMPYAICMLGSNGMAVSDLSDGSVQIYDSSNVLLNSLGIGVGEFLLPIDIAWDPTAAEIYVCDARANRVAVYGLNGLQKRVIGSLGSGNGQFRFPSGVAIRPNGTEIYVADQGNYRVQVLDTAGNYLRQVGSRGSLDGQFVRIQGVTSDIRGVLFISDAFHDDVQVIDSHSGSFLGALGQMGVTPGTGLLQPCGVALDPVSRRLYVASTNTQSIEIFDATPYTVPAAVADWMLLEEAAR